MIDNTCFVFCNKGAEPIFEGTRQECADWIKANLDEYGSLTALIPTVQYETMTFRSSNDQSSGSSGGDGNSVVQEQQVR